MAPYVGRSPNRPQNAAGMRTELPVSVPNEASQNPAATAAAEPPLEPPAMRLSSNGLRHWPPTAEYERTPQASSVMLALPISRAPASNRRCTTTALCLGWRSRQKAAPAVVGAKSVSMLSLSDAVRAWSSLRPPRMLRSYWALTAAASGTVINARRRSLWASIWAACCSTLYTIILLSVFLIRKWETTQSRERR